MDGNVMNSREEHGEKTEKKYTPPQIRVDDDVREDEPHVSIGKRKASIGPPIILRRLEK